MRRRLRERMKRGEERRRDVTERRERSKRGKDRR
jgi:hypothetical protein